MIRVFFVLFSSVVFVGATTSVVPLQPWKAAEAVLKVLPEDTVLKAVDLDTAELFCGHRMKLGLEIDDRLHEVMIGHEADWKELKTPNLHGMPVRLENLQDSDLDVVLDDCLLPEVTLTGPLDIRWTEQSRATLMNPPEPYVVPNVERLIVEDGVDVTLSGLTELKLKEPIALLGLTQDYFDELHRNKNTNRRSMSQIQGLLEISAALHGKAKEGITTALELVARSTNEGFSVRRHRQTSMNIIEASPGLLRIFPSTRRVERSVRSLDALRIWPFVDASPSLVLSYEQLLKQVLGHHWPQMHAHASIPRLKQAWLQAVTLLRVRMEVQSNVGQTRLLDAHVLINNDEEYTALGAQPIKADQYTTSISHLDLFHNQTTDPNLSLYDMYF